MTGQTPPGWYHDPYGTPGLQRYWDGGQWTQATQPADEWDDADPAQGTPGSSPSDYGASPQAQGPSTPPPWSPQAQGPSTPPPWPSQPQGPSTPPPWSSQPGQPGAWTPQGPPTPSPWPSPSQGPGTPQPWQPPQQPRQSNNGLIWGLIGGGALVVAIIVVVALVATGTFKDGDPSPSPTVAGSSPSGAVPSSDPNAQSPRVGTVIDTQSGVSYAQLGGKWTAQTISPDSGFARTYGFNKGQIAEVQQNYKDGKPYLASAYSGRLPTSVRYTGTGDLESAATSFGRTIETEPEPNGSYPSHTRQDLESKSSSVGGKSGWYSKFRLGFPQAASSGWNFRTETVIFLLIDQGSARPSVVWLTVPDSHENGGDLDLLVNSVRPQ